MNNKIKIFHLHFYTKHYKEIEEFFVSELGFKVKGRFSKNDGPLDKNISWNEIESKNIPLRLIEIEKGLVNIVLMPARFDKAKLEHFGLLLTEDNYKSAISKAKGLGLNVRQNPNRTFIDSKLGFRIEIHNIDSDYIQFSQEKFNELYIKELEFSIDNSNEFCLLLNHLFAIELSGNNIKVGESKITLTHGNFSLKSFRLAGKEFNPDIKNDLPHGVPILF